MEVRTVLSCFLADAVEAWELGPDGRYGRVRVPDEGWRNNPILEDAWTPWMETAQEIGAQAALIKMYESKTYREV